MVDEVFKTNETREDGRVILLQSSDLTHIAEEEGIRDLLSEIGLGPREFQRLIDGDFDVVEGPDSETLDFGGTVREEATVRIANIGGRQIEVTHCYRPEDSKQAPPTIDMQLTNITREGEYKILVVLAGEATLYIPDEVYPAGHLYATNDKGTEVPLLKGRVAYMKAPAAWQFRSSKAGFTYLYISYPRHRSHTDMSVHEA